MLKVPETSVYLHINLFPTSTFFFLIFKMNFSWALLGFKIIPNPVEDIKCFINHL